MKPTPIETLREQAKVRQRSAAFVFHENVWTYERILVEAERLARGMVAHGLKPGDRVAVHMMNRPEFIVAYYACFLVGAIVSPLRTAFKQAELEPLLRRLRPALYIGETALYGNVAAIDGELLPRDRRFLVETGSGVNDGLPLQQLFDDAGRGDLPFSPAADQPAVLITTSGTTGEPKFVIHTASSVTESAERISNNWELAGQDGIAMPLPLAHMSGVAVFFACIYSGTPFILIESFDADTVLDTIEKYRCSMQLGFPAQYAALLEHQRARPRDLTSLRYCLTGGDVCPVELQRQFTAAFGVPLYNAWGATEAVGNLGYALRPGPVLRITRPEEVRLVDDDGKDVADGELGELLVRGPNLFAGYWNDLRATTESLKDGWYHTGDLARREAQGELLFVARKKDIIIRGGTNISPVEVEQAVAAHPSVEDAAVVGVPDAVLGQRVVGFVTLVKGKSERVVPGILSDLATRLAAYKVPEHLIVLDALPRNALSKVDRARLQAMAIEGDKVSRSRAAASAQRNDEQASRRAS
ncbi:class I adenylate-forming enzyme family protein [Bradyrhizobium sp. Ai1a-2]|uniref:class I adenylate-forming enzyme family protein n=1 Tax=Bradyrhizobium sp. Ai1a-2 TaxID=196490 RepID=UPI0004241F3A|nr:class I adenylate-forming enzyme family protein [Bradyrhizobium sp. Ai1a-2]